MKNWIWWWRHHCKGATISKHTSERKSVSKSRELRKTTRCSEGVRLLIWSTKLQSMEPGGKILTPCRRLENVFSGRQLGLVQEKTQVVFYTRMPRETVRQRGKKWRTQEDLARASILFSTESEGTDWREKLKQSRCQSCDCFVWPVPDLRWEHALLLTSDPPSDNVLECLYVSKLQDSFPNSDNFGTIQSRYPARRTKTRLSQTENVCEITYWASSKR